VIDIVINPLYDNIEDGKIAKTLQKTPANQNFYDLLVLGLHNKA
jgi:hypothetical protein